MDKQTLIKNPDNSRSHVVLLGAGTSRAAFPNGDENGTTLPLMDDFVDTLGLSALLDGLNLDIDSNFESIYSAIDDQSIRMELEKRIDEYFLSLSLPETVTDYDRLVLSLCEKDAIFTFNWDPFLFDAWMRNHHAVKKLPEIFFLHGNVRIGYCDVDSSFGRRHHRCCKCKNKLKDVPLLYPIKSKNYSQNGYISQCWKEAEELIANAFTLTIFGYSAPIADVDAVELLHQAWLANGTRAMEHVEIIDIADSNTLHERWKSFTPTNHYQIRRSLAECRLLQWPRRSCEALFLSMSKGEPCEQFPMPLTDNLVELQEYISKIVDFENSDD